MKGASAGVNGDSEQTATIMQQHRREQHELQHQRSVLDDLEFQMFEASVSSLIVSISAAV